MSFTNKWSVKVASGVGAVGVAAGLFAGAASASTPTPVAAKPAASAASTLQITPLATPLPLLAIVSLCTVGRRLMSG